MISLNPYTVPKAGVVRQYHTLPLESVKWLQYELQRLGMYIGRIDGIYGYKTDKAVRAYQRSLGEDDTGIVGKKLVERLQWG